MSLIHQIEEMSMNYGSGSRRAIGEFVLKEKGKLHQYTIQEIADETYTSKAALVRFAQTLGFSGWKEFLKAFMEELKYQESHYTDVDPNFPFTGESRNADVINQLCSLQVESLLDTADLLEHAPLDPVVELLEKSARVAIFCLNPNLLLAQMFTRKMLSIGRYIEIPNQGDVGMLAATLGENDCAIVISYSGSTVDHDPLNVLPRLKQRNVTVVGITSMGENYLRQNSDYVFTISSRERLYSKIATFATETSILYILNVLFSCYFKKNYKQNCEYKISNARILERANRHSVEQEMTELEEMEMQ